MERNKFEKQLKKQLQGREIQPSNEAWNRISRQLEGIEKPQSARFQWYGIAAGFIGILFVSVLYFTTKETSALPETEISDVVKDTLLFDKIPKTIHEEKSRQGNAVASSKAQEEKPTESTSPKNREEPIEDAIAGLENEDAMVQKVAMPLNTSEEIIDAKIAEIVVQVEGLEKKNSTVTDAEIDSLLRSAQRQILEDKIFRKDKSVDAMVLLADVEDELDDSFRDQIFEALKDGFLRVRTAVADRNK